MAVTMPAAFFMNCIFMPSASAGEDGGGDGNRTKPPVSTRIVLACPTTWYVTADVTRSREAVDTLTPIAKIQEVKISPTSAGCSVWFRTDSPLLPNMGITSTTKAAAATEPVINGETECVYCCP
eukprot:CAMPEP_0175093290 /NCGR_PEP_ID=MMETSP0086_2-20121207/2929_1 /TAXON_ID=136419 /ORGANISM="Unknown Unknown, Strain D1" /LENGTH=123 /DNA_ID=CAMNT_0016366233 /DNA_START=295 /DNA_END=663 /DNA_ORIENTATION=+